MRDCYNNPRLGITAGTSKYLKWYFSRHGQDRVGVLFHAFVFPTAAINDGVWLSTLRLDRVHRHFIAMQGARHSHGTKANEGSGHSSTLFACHNVSLSNGADSGLSSLNRAEFRSTRVNEVRTFLTACRCHSSAKMIECERMHRMHQCTAHLNCYRHSMFSA